MKLIRIPKEEIRALISDPDFASIHPEERDEMAIPTYLHPNPLIQWLFWRRYALIAKLARLPAGGNALEFGCGIGVFLPTLAGQAGNLYAVDLFPQFAQKLAQNHKLRVQFTQVDQISDCTLDLIVAADVMEHLDDPTVWLEKFYRTLRPGGALVISGPTESFIYKLGRLAAGYGGKGGYHHSNIEVLAALIEKAGFRLCVEESLPFFFPPHLFKILRFEKDEFRAASG